VGSRIALVVIVSVTLLGAASVQKAETLRPARVVAVKAVCAMFLEPDADALAPLVDKNAEYGAGKGLNVVDEVRREGLEGARRLSVKEIIFFGKQDVRDLVKRFPVNSLWNEHRALRRMDNAIGCLVVSEPLSKDPNDIEYDLHLLVVKQVQGEYKVVYFDDDWFKIEFPDGI